MKIIKSFQLPAFITLILLIEVLFSGAEFSLSSLNALSRAGASSGEVAKALSSEQIARAFREFKTDTGWITRRILRYREESEANYILSYEPARIHTIFVETESREVKEIVLPLPTLILFGKKNEWLSDQRKKSRSSPLCLASAG